mgnify:CR=1 FL=1
MWVLGLGLGLGLGRAWVPVQEESTVWLRSRALMAARLARKRRQSHMSSFLGNLLTCWTQLVAGVKLWWLMYVVWGHLLLSARVVELNSCTPQVSATSVFVHYVWWSSKWDEEISKDSPRLAPSRSHICTRL